MVRWEQTLFPAIERDLQGLKSLTIIFGFMLLDACASSQKAFESLVIENYGSKEHGWQRPSGALLENPVADDARSRTHGAGLYGRYCSVCHGPQGLGDGPAAAGRTPPPANLQAKDLNRSDNHLYLQVSLGREGMPIWDKELTDQDRWDLVNYIKSLGSEDRFRP